MALREKLMLKDGKARPPAVIRKICCHNGSPNLEQRFRGDVGFDIDFILGRQEEIYCCIQCGHTVSAEAMMHLYQNYITNGVEIVIGRRIKTV